MSKRWQKSESDRPKETDEERQIRLACQHCFGTGWRPRIPGDKLAGVRRCDHRDYQPEMI